MADLRTMRLHAIAVLMGIEKPDFVFRSWPELLPDDREHIRLEVRFRDSKGEQREAIGHFDPEKAEAAGKTREEVTEEMFESMVLALYSVALVEAACNTEVAGAPIARAELIEAFRIGGGVIRSSGPPPSPPKKGSPLN